MAATLVFKIIGDASQATSTLDKVSGTLDKMVGPALAAGAGIAAGLGFAVAKASEAEQAVGAMTAVFGEQSAAMTKAAGAANDLGLSTASYNDAAAITGALLKNTGTETDALAGQTESLIKSAADMAAQFGGSTTDALGGIQSMLKGSYEVMDNYGVKLTAADVQARALADGTSTAEAAIAIMNEQLAQTGTQDAAAREMGTMASQTATAKAAIDDAAAAIGDDLLPYLADLAGALADGAAWVAEHETAVRNAAIAVGIFAGAILAMNALVKVARGIMIAYNAVMAAVRVAQMVAATATWLFAAAEMAALLPIALIVLGIVALIAIIVLLVKNWDKVTAVMKKLWDWIKGVFIAVWDSLTGAIDKVIGKIRAVWDWIQKILNSGIDTVMGWFGKSAGPAGAMASTTAQLMPTASSGRANTNGGGPTIVFNGLVTDPESTARAIRRILEGSDQRNGWAVA
jgi:hypothetical protein